MTRGVPRDGVRKTNAWYKRHNLPNPRLVGNKAATAVLRARAAQASPDYEPMATSTALVPYTAPPVPALPDETDEQIDTRIAERFCILGQMVDATICGSVRALIVSGPPGLGKSFMIEQKLMAYDPNEINHTFCKGHVQATGLYKKLYKYKERGQIVVFDDADKIFFDESALNLLKAACDTSQRRRLSWLSEAALFDDDTGVKLNNHFEFEGTVIFITNYDFDAMIARQHKLAPHLSALMSRGLYVDLTMKTARDCLIRVRQVVNQGLMADQGLDDEAQTEVMGFIEKNLTSLREISLRTAIKIAGLRSFGGAWEAVAKVTCCKKKGS